MIVTGIIIAIIIVVAILYCNGFVITTSSLEAEMIDDIYAELDEMHDGLNELRKLTLSLTIECNKLIKELEELNK